MYWESVFSKRCQSLSHTLKMQTHHYYWYLKVGFFRALNLSNSQYKARKEMFLFNGTACQILHQVDYTTPEQQQKGGVPLSVRRETYCFTWKTSSWTSYPTCVNQHTIFVSEELIYDSWRPGSSFEASEKSD